jgi:hypothetical protein
MPISGEPTMVIPPNTFAALIAASPENISTSPTPRW